MTKVLTFRVEISGLENKIWRKIEITDRRTVADLAYTILATFDSLSYHLYEVIHSNDRYDCMIDPFESKQYNFKDAVNTKLSDVDFSKNNKMIMNYDISSPTTFIITHIESRDLEKYNGNHYPYIVDGEGRGMIDDISDGELEDIVDDIDKKGYSNHLYTPGYDNHLTYDYRYYDIECDNALLKGNIIDIKNGYECDDE